MKALDWFRTQSRHANSLATCTSLQDYASETGAVQDAEIAFPNTISDAERREAELSGLDFIEAITAHQRWKNRLRQFIEDKSTERLDYQIVCRDDACALGQWLHGSGEVAHGRRSIFGQLIQAHAQFHQAAGNVVQLKSDRKDDEARDALWSGEFAMRSATVQSLVSALFMELREPDYRN